MLTLFAAAVTLMGGPDTPMPGTPVNGPSAVGWPFGSGLIDTGIKTTSDSYTDGHFSITAPIFSDVGKDGTLGGNVVFIEPYISWGEQGEVATSLGIGYRHLFNQQPLTALQQPSAGLLAEGLMLGGNVFLDMLDTQTDNRFWQLGFGLEVATRYLELRANYYQPLTGRQEGDPILQREVQRGTFLTSGKEPFATGHTIQQDVTFTTYDFYTDYLYRTYEEGLEGWDAEAALLVPGLDKWCELWLIGGYGSFENKPFGPQLVGTGEVAGWKAGVEFRPVPQMVLSATWFEDERMSGGEWLYGLSLQLPLDLEPGNTSKSWWRKLKDTPRPRSRHLAERSAVPVHRQNAAIKVGHSISEPEVTQYTKVVSEVEKRVVVRDDVIFVNNGGAQGNGIAAHGTVEDGTAERPFDTIQEGVDLSATAGYQARGVPTVYVSGRASSAPIAAIAGGYSYDFGVITTSLRLVSGGYGIPAFAGQKFGLGTPAVIDDVVIGSETSAPIPVVYFDGFFVPGSITTYNVNQLVVRGNVMITSGAALHVIISRSGFYSSVILGNQISENYRTPQAFTRADGIVISIRSSAPKATVLAVIRDNRISLPYADLAIGIEINSEALGSYIVSEISGNTVLRGFENLIPFYFNGGGSSVISVFSKTSNQAPGYPTSVGASLVPGTVYIFDPSVFGFITVNGVKIGLY